MKNFSYALLCLIFYTSIYAQVTFEKGYFITNDSTKTECLIKNVDWSYNPIEFEYKIAETDPSTTIKMVNVMEFGIYDFSKYIRAAVKIDKSSDNIARIDEYRSPRFVEDVLFLKVLIEGEASLYEYANRDINRFFYKVKEAPIDQLVYKKYQADRITIAENRQFQTQLFEQVNCNKTDLQLNKVNYNSYELIKYFTDYNQCKGSKFENMVGKQKRDGINLKFKPGISISNASMRNDFSNGGKDVNFPSAISHHISVECEFVLPFNRNTWSLFIDPSYQSYNGKTTALSSGPIYTTDTINITLNNIEFPLGIRRYFFLNPQSKLSLHAAYIIDWMLGSELKYDNNFLIKPAMRPRLCLGAAFAYKKWGIEARYYLNQNILPGINWESAYKKITASVTYQLF